VLNFAKNNGLVNTDVAWKGVKPFADSHIDPDESHRYLTRDERKKIIDACADLAKPFIELMACIGARPVELMRATVGDYNPRIQELTLWSKKGNSSQRRVRKIPVGTLPGALDVVLRQIKGKLPAAPLFDIAEHNDYLIPVKDAVVKSGLPTDVTAYSLRHSFITDSLAAGVPIHLVASITGTSIAQIDATYGKTIQEHAKAAFSKLAAING
jgi:integrase